MDEKTVSRINFYSKIMIALMILSCAVGLFIPNFFKKEGMMVVEAERNKLQIVTTQEEEYKNIGVIDASELVVIEDAKYYVNDEGKLMTGFSVDGEFMARATTETETYSYIKHLYKSGELEVPHAWAISTLGVDELKLFLISAAPFILTSAAGLASIRLVCNEKEEN